MKKDYSIGVAVTANENECVGSMLSSLEQDLQSFQAGGIETIVCLNGYDRETEKAVDGIGLNPLNIRKVYSKRGLIPAQRKIIEESDSKSNFILFYDADVLIQPGSTKAMFDFTDHHPEVHAASGEQYARKDRSFLYGVYNIIGINPQIMTRRRYLTGKIFAIRKEDYFVPDFLVSEDIFLSRYLINRFGSCAIGSVSGASVEYVGPRTLRDYYEKRRRLALEVEKIDKNCPQLLEHGDLFKKQFIQEEVSKLTKKERLQLFLHDLIKEAVKRHAKNSSRENVWVPLKSTKSIAPKR